MATSCDPFGNSMLSTIAAAIPVVTLLVLIATGAVKTHLAALIALLVVIIIAVLLFTMPAGLAIRASILGAVIGFFPIGWIRAQRHLHAPADGGDWGFCDVAAGDRRGYPRPPACSWCC